MRVTFSAPALLLACLGGCGGSNLEPRPPGAGQQQPRAAFDINGIIGTGQSLSVGAEAPDVSAAAAQQPYNNLKLSLGGATVPPFDPGAASLALVPLTEPIRAQATTFPSAYPANLYGESPHAAMAAQITKLAREAGLPDYVSAHSVVGESGQGMSIIDKTASESVDGAKSTGRAYAASLFEAKAIARLSDAQSKSYG
ncbi:MAG: dockerin, partial [Polyangiaceae bacterium]